MGSSDLAAVASGREQLTSTEAAPAFTAARTPAATGSPDRSDVPSSAATASAVTAAVASAASAAADGAAVHDVSRNKKRDAEAPPSLIRAARQTKMTRVPDASVSTSPTNL